MNGKIGKFGLVLLVVCSGCRAPQAVDQRSVALRGELKTVTLSDGVSRSEADIIARCYFVKHVGCGGFQGIQDGGDQWIVKGLIGYIGKPVKGFYIDKQSGKVTSTVGPSYENPLSIFP